jgi:PAS domain S-box-containing protein
MNKDTLLQVLLNTGDGAMAIDRSQRVLLWNCAAEEILGYSASEVVGQRCYRLLAGRTPQCLPWCQHECTVVEQARREKAIKSFEVIGKHKDGRMLPLEVSTIVLPPNNPFKSSPLLLHLFRSREITREQPDIPNDGLYIRLLGPVQVRRADGSTLNGKLWRQTKVRALLAYLALHKGHLVHQEKLVEQLWPELDGTGARQNLYTAVYNLRRTLEPDLSRTKGSRYILKENNSYMLQGKKLHWLDVNAFENQLNEARKVKNTNKALVLFKKAVELYRGDFLADVGSIISWHWREQERLKELYLDALTELGDCYVNLQNHTLALETYRNVLAIDPCREATCQSLMRVALKQGDRPTALVYYKNLAQELDQELGVTPSEETLTLYQEILQSQ